MGMTYRVCVWASKVTRCVDGDSSCIGRNGLDRQLRIRSSGFEVSYSVAVDHVSLHVKAN
jgi:hypothetical protein